ncbi:MAG: amidohydrolase family protein [Clostridiales bacterium]|nr:amidohydrolase family protein [Clostridiales bacterium]MCF8023094.1 amidohydrolase family protein [Clostridiales bacterium]
MQIILKNSALFDGTGNDLIKDSLVAFENGIITYAGPANDFTVKKNSRVYNLSNKYIIPGLIDAHIHLDLHGMADTYLENLVENKLRAIRAAKEMETTIQAGFTTVRNMGSVDYIDIAVKEAIKQELITGPRVLTSGKIICMHSSGESYFSGMYREADGVDENRKAAREQLAEGAEYLKVMATGAIMNPGGVPAAPQLDIDEIRAVVEEGKKLGKHTAAHAHGAQGIKNAIKAGVRTIEHGTMADDEAIKMMVDNGIYMIPTLSSNYLMLLHGEKDGVPQFMMEKAKEISEIRKKVTRKAIDAGVKIAMGTDAGTPYNYHGKNSLEITRFVDENLINEKDAVIASTRKAAEALDLGDKLGTIEKGKFADLVVLEKNPLEDIHCLLDPENIIMRFKEGVLIT